MSRVDICRICGSKQTVTLLGVVRTKTGWVIPLEFNCRNSRHDSYLKNPDNPVLHKIRWGRIPDKLVAPIVDYLIDIQDAAPLTEYHLTKREETKP